MTSKANIESVITENDRRKAVFDTKYNPITGEGSLLDRMLISYSVFGQKQWLKIPLKMYEDNRKLVDKLIKVGSVEGLVKEMGQSVNGESITVFIKAFNEIRFDYDFEFWAITCVKIQDKDTKVVIPFMFNRAQRRFLSVLEKMRLASISVRIVLLKARQWGGSTLVQVYMAWIQLRLKNNWHSAIVAQTEDVARHIRGMYTRLGREYPSDFGKVIFTPYEGSSKNRKIEGRNCIVGIGSSEKPDNLRAFDFSMAHLSEAGYWKSTPQKSAEDLAQSIRALVPPVPYSMIILESTAKGVGTFFHREWLAAESKTSSYEAVFVPWFEIERYQSEIKDQEKFVKWMRSEPYAEVLWNLGATLEGIKWYFDFKRNENYSDWRMHEEFPSTSNEAFVSTGSRVFAPEYVVRARKNCIPPEFIGDLFARSQKGRDAFKDIEFQPNERGLFFIWAMPDKETKVSERYAVTVDIGGRTEKADWSVIKVFDRLFMKDGGKPEVVATWRGHLDQDLVSWKGAQIAYFYNKALYVVESNSLDKDETEGSEGDHFLTVLDEIVKYYDNIYARTDPEKIKQGLPIRYGFLTDRSTKPMVIDELNGALREEAYVERDMRAPDEFDTYEVKPNGKYGAVMGCHDDLVMVTAIGTWICFKYMGLPKDIVFDITKVKRKIVSEASF